MAETLEGARKYRSTDCGVCAFISQRMRSYLSLPEEGTRMLLDGF